MKSSFAVLVLLLLTVAAAACGATPAVQTERSGTRVTVAGGSYTNVDAKTLQAMLAQKDFFFVNVHVPYEGEIEKTDAFVPYDQVEQNIGKFPPDKNARIFLYCRSGRMSAIAAEKLVQLGYANVWNLDGGMIVWEQQGFPLLKK